VTRSSKLKVGYFAQNQMEELPEGRTAGRHLATLMPGVPEAKVRAHLGRFGLTGQRAETRIADLSGGEKARLLLAAITREAPHLLLLDEPTNHLDVDAREALVQALNEYEGAVVLVSHDSHLVDLVVDRLWLVANGTCTPFDGDLGTGEVQIGGQPARKLAESSRSLIVESPATALGPVGLVLSDPGYAGRFEFRALRIDVEAPRVSIGEGEEIALRAHVAGLEGLDEELPLLAVNRTPEVVAMGGEESRGTMRHLVRPAQVAADGSYTFELPVTGQSHGDFEILVAALQKADEDASMHVVNVTNPPHYAPVTNPDEHATNVTWPEVHAANVTFPDHTANVTWPPRHYANITWAEHATHITDWLPPTEPETGEEEEEPVEGEVEEGEPEGTGTP